MYVCIYIFVYIYICVYVCMYLCMYVCMYECMYVCVCMYVADVNTGGFFFESYLLQIKSAPCLSLTYSIPHINLNNLSYLNIVRWYMWIFFLCCLFCNNCQKQPTLGVLSKRCSENMLQIYKKTPMLKGNFNKVAFQLY